MTRFLYDAALFALVIFFFPKLLIDFLFKKKYRKSLKLRLKPKAPGGGDKEVIWLHAVSMGETKALSTLVPHIRKSHRSTVCQIRKAPVSHDEWRQSKTGP